MSGGSTIRRVRVTSGRSSSTWWLKKALLTLLIIGGLGSFTVASTFAVLSSDTSNGKTSLASGTLTFGNKVGTATTCNSYGAGSSSNVNNACDAIFTSATEMFPGVPAITSLQIVNNGSLDASDLTLYMPTCTPGDTTGAPSPGAGSPCDAGGLQLYVQETNAAGTTNVKCWYPTAATTCSFINDTLSLFVGNFTSVTTALDLGSGPAHGATRYFKIGVQLPSDASNTLQGRTATFGLTWHITN
jgi:hypothetical protein